MRRKKKRRTSRSELCNRNWMIFRLRGCLATLQEASKHPEFSRSDHEECRHAMFHISNVVAAAALSSITEEDTET